MKMRPINVLCILVVAFAICACATKPVVPVAPLPTVETKQTVDIDPSLIQDCPSLNSLDVRNYSKAETLQVMNEWANQYSVCKRNHHSLSGIVIKAFNIDPASAPVAASTPTTNSK